MRKPAIIISRSFSFPKTLEARVFGVHFVVGKSTTATSSSLPLKVVKLFRFGILTMTFDKDIIIDFVVRSSNERKLVCYGLKTEFAMVPETTTRNKTIMDCRRSCNEDPNKC